MMECHDTPRSGRIGSCREACDRANWGRKACAACCWGSVVGLLLVFRPASGGTVAGTAAYFSRSCTQSGSASCSAAVVTLLEIAGRVSLVNRHANRSLSRSAKSPHLRAHNATKSTRGRLVACREPPARKSTQRRLLRARNRPRLATEPDSASARYERFPNRGRRAVRIAAGQPSSPFCRRLAFSSSPSLRSRPLSSADPTGMVPRAGGSSLVPAARRIRRRRFPRPPRLAFPPLGARASGIVHPVEVHIRLASSGLSASRRTAMTPLPPLGGGDGRANEDIPRLTRAGVRTARRHACGQR